MNIFLTTKFYKKGTITQKNKNKKECFNYESRINKKLHAMGVYRDPKLNKT